MKLTAYRTVAEGTHEWWASYVLEVDTQREAERVAVGGPPAGDDENLQRANVPAVGVKPAARGQRRRLLPPPAAGRRALPSCGKLEVTFDGVTCAAAITLPAAEKRCAPAAAAAAFSCVPDRAPGACPGTRPAWHPSSGRRSGTWLGRGWPCSSSWSG